MRRFHTILFLALVLALVVSQASAQGRMRRGGQGMGQGMGKENCVPGVNLSSEQGQRIAAIRQETREEVQSIMRNPNLSAAEKRSRVQAAQQEGHDRVLDVLTDEQRRQFNQNWRQGCKAGMGQGMGPGQNQGNVPGVQGITPEQRQRIAEIRQETQREVAETMSDTRLTPEQRRASADEIRRDGHERVLDVLTPEQRRQFQEKWASTPRGKGNR